MSKRLKATVVNAPVDFVSISDVGLHHGRAENTIENCANFALDNIKGFPVKEDISEENIQSLKTGYVLAHKEQFKPVTYAVINGHYVQATPDHLSADNVEKIELTIDHCMSFTSNEIGTDFKDQPELKALIQKVRKAHSTYVNQKLDRLCAKGVELLKERNGEKKTREVVLFEKGLTDFFNKQDKSVKVKQQRGDATANPLQYRIAVEAFWKAYHS